MSFDPRPLASPQDRSIVGQFVASWYLEPHDRSPELGKHSTDSEQRERIVRSFLTARVMESLLPFHGWSLRVRSGRLIVWRGEGFCSADDREPLARTASNLRAVLVGAEPSSHEEMIPAQPGDSYQVQCRRILGAMLGGVFGTIAGFLGGFAVFLSFFRPISMSPSSDVSLILLFPVCLIGGLALGALSGALAGSLLSRFLSKDASFDANFWMIEPSGWVIGGMFVGFLSGGLASAAMMMLIEKHFGLSSISAWATLPIVLTGPVVGLLSGLFAGRRMQSSRNRGGRAPE